MADQPQQPQPKKKMTTGVLLLLVVGSCFGLSILMSIGKSLSYGGVVLGFLGAGGCGYLLVKGPAHLKKLILGGGVLCLLLVVFGFMGAGENREKAAAEAAAIEAAKKKAGEDKARLEKVATSLAALDANAPSSQVVGLCSEVEKAGGIPPAQSSRCGDAYLVEGQAALAAKRPADAVTLLSQAVKLSSKKVDAQSALNDATVAVATEAATADIKRADEALATKDLAKAAAAAKSASQRIAAGLQAKPDDAVLKGLAAKVEGVLGSSDPTKLAAAFAAMSPKDHLAAAKVALADGYNAKKKTGGQLDVAESHLKAIDASVGESKDAKRLQQEIDWRRKRDSKGIYADIVGGKLVVTDENRSMAGLKEVAVQGHLTLSNLAKEAFEDVPDLQSLTVVEYATYEDVRGNEKRTKVGEFMVTRTTAKGINWDNVRSGNLLKVINKAWVAPGVSIIVD